MRTWRRKLIILATAAMLLAACDGGPSGGSDKQGSAACPGAGGAKPAKAILACNEDAIAFVETEAATGTGVVIEVGGKAYVLTNAHVVDPFASADVVIDGKPGDGLPVVGVDVGADIAVVGPLAAKPPKALTIGDADGLERGDDLFLVGFPGESSADDLETTIASGIVSRTRKLAEFGHTYVQTDASIGGGQSGGPMFDGNGQLVGISGLSFAENFALALSGSDVRTAVDRIVAGKGDSYAALPSSADAPAGVGDAAAGATAGKVTLTDANDGQVLFLPAQPADTTWNLTVEMGAKPIVSVETYLESEPLALSSNAAQIERQVTQEMATLRGGRPDDLPDTTAAGADPKIAARETAPGSFAIPVKADTSAIVVIAGPLIDARAEVGWTSNLPLFAASRPVIEKRLELGKSFDESVWAFDTGVDVLVDLEVGQKVEFHARSPQGDVGYMVFGPDLRADHLTVLDPETAGATVVEDTEDGLYGLDAKEVFVAEKAGTHRVRVYINDDVSVLVRFTALDCAVATCTGPKKKSSA